MSITLEEILNWIEDSASMEELEFVASALRRKRKALERLELPNWSQIVEEAFGVPVVETSRGVSASELHRLLDREQCLLFKTKEEWQILVLTRPEGVYWARWTTYGYLTGILGMGKLAILIAKQSRQPWRVFDNEGPAIPGDGDIEGAIALIKKAAKL